jgi:hypothetical protein
MKCCKIIIGLLLFNSGVYGQNYNHNPNLSSPGHYIDSLKKAGIDTIIELSEWNGGGVRPERVYTILWKAQNYIYEILCGDVYFIDPVPSVYKTKIKNDDPFNYFKEYENSIRQQEFVSTNPAFPVIEIYVFMKNNTFEKDCHYVEVKLKKKNKASDDFFIDSGKNVKTWIDMIEGNSDDDNKRND